MATRRPPRREIEARIAVRDGEHARRLLANLGVAAGRTGPALPWRDLYLDTARRDLLAAGYALRVRTLPTGHREATILSIAGPEPGGSDDREEPPTPVARPIRAADGLPPGAVRDLAARATEGRPLEAIVAMRGLRHSFRVRPATGLEVLVSHEKVRGRCGRGRSRVALEDVVVRRVAGSPATFAEWLERTLAASGGRPGGPGVFERALRAGRVPRPTSARMAASRLALRPPSGPAAPATEALAGTLGRLAAWLGRASLAARRGSVDGIHDVRTVSRRLRAVLAAHRDEVPDRARRDLRDRLDGLRRAAGPVRDLDVLREAIDGVRLPPADAAGAAALKGVLAEQRRPLVRDLRAALASPRLAGLPDRVGRLAAEVLGRPAPPLAVVAAARLPLAMERSLARLAVLPRPASSAPAEALHAFRIAVKRARYAAEAFAPAFGRPVARFREALVALQDALGGLQDAHVIAAALEPLVTEAAKGGRDGAAARRAAEAIGEALSVRASALRASLDARIDAALGREALRDLHDHLAKRAARAVADARR